MEDTLIALIFKKKKKIKRLMIFTNFFQVIWLSMLSNKDSLQKNAWEELEVSGVSNGLHAYSLFWVLDAQL